MGERKGILFVETVEEASFLPNLGVFRVTGGPSAVLRKWFPRIILVVLDTVRRGWVELWGLPFPLWSEEHLKKMM